MRKRIKLGRLSPGQVNSEHRITAKEAAGMFTPPAARYDIYHWRTRGISIDGKRVILGWFHVGTRVYTTEQAVRRFADAAGQTLSGESPSSRKKNR